MLLPEACFDGRDGGKLNFSIGSTSLLSYCAVSDLGDLEATWKVPTSTKSIGRRSPAAEGFRGSLSSVWDEVERPRLAQLPKYRSCSIRFCFQKACLDKVRMGKEYYLYHNEMIQKIPDVGIHPESRTRRRKRNPSPKSTTSQQRCFFFGNMSAIPQALPMSQMFRPCSNNTIAMKPHHSS